MTRMAIRAVRITVVAESLVPEVDPRTSSIAVRGQEGLDRLLSLGFAMGLQKQGTTELIVDFEELEAGGTYTYGPGSGSVQAGMDSAGWIRRETAAMEQEAIVAVLDGAERDYGRLTELPMNRKIDLAAPIMDADGEEWSNLEFDGFLAGSNVLVLVSTKHRVKWRNIREFEKACSRFKDALENHQLPKRFGDYKAHDIVQVMIGTEFEDPLRWQCRARGIRIGYRAGTSFVLEERTKPP